MVSMYDKMLSLFNRFERGEISFGRLRELALSAAVEDDEYVTLDSVLGRGRHDDESGVDLRFPTR